MGGTILYTLPKISLRVMLAAMVASVDLSRYRYALEVRFKLVVQNSDEPRDGIEVKSQCKMFLRKLSHAWSFNAFGETGELLGSCIFSDQQ